MLAYAAMFSQSIGCTSNQATATMRLGGSSYWLMKQPKSASILTCIPRRHPEYCGGMIPLHVHDELLNQAKITMLNATVAPCLGLFRTLLVPMSGPSTTGVLQVNCALGDVPRERSVEGIPLTLERYNSEYSEEISGRVMFLSIRPEMGTPVTTPREQKATENSEQPHN